MKRLSNFFYLVSQGVKSVFKNAVMSVASLLTLLSCLLVLGSFYMIIDNIGENAKMTDKLNQLVVTLDKSLTDEQIEEVKQSVAGLDNILSWTYKSKEETLEQLRENGVEIVSNVTDETNPLPNTIEVTFADVASANTLVYQLEKLEGVTEVSDKLEVRDYEHHQADGFCPPRGNRYYALRRFYGLLRHDAVHHRGRFHRAAGRSGGFRAAILYLHLCFCGHPVRFRYFYEYVLALCAAAGGRVRRRRTVYGRHRLRPEREALFA